MTTSDLAGSSAFFSNAKPGIPFNALLFSDTADPVIFLDELDKNSTSQYDALGALYVLLEPSTVKTYKDQCYPIKLNCSEVLYLAACNSSDPDRLNPALVTSFKQFNVSITPEQSRKIAESIVASTMRKLAPATDELTFSPSAMAALSTMTPRRISQAVTEAIGKAFADEVSVIDSIPSAVAPKRGMGFIH